MSLHFGLQWIDYKDFNGLVIRPLMGLETCYNSLHNFVWTLITRLIIMYLIPKYIGEKREQN